MDSETVAHRVGPTNLPLEPTKERVLNMMLTCGMAPTCEAPLECRQVINKSNLPIGAMTNDPSWTLALADREELQTKNSDGAFIDGPMADPKTGHRFPAIAQDVHMLPIDHPDAVDGREEVGINFNERYGFVTCILL